MVTYHLDTDFLVLALTRRGPEHQLLSAIADSDDLIEVAALVWYEFCRGPRTPEQVAVARNLVEDDGVIAFDEDHALRAAELFRRLNSPRRRAYDVAIASIAIARGARLLTGNARDYSGIEGLELGPAV